MLNSWNVCLPMGCTIKVIIQQDFYPIKRKINCLSIISFFGEEKFTNFYSLHHETFFGRMCLTFIFLLAFCRLNQSFAAVTISITVKVGSIPFTFDFRGWIGLCYSLCHWVPLHSVKLTKTCDSMFLQYRKYQFLLKPSLYILFCSV